MELSHLFHVVRAGGIPAGAFALLGVFLGWPRASPELIGSGDLYYGNLIGLHHVALNEAIGTMIGVALGGAVLGLVLGAVAVFLGLTTKEDIGAE